MTKQIDISIVIVNYNVKDFLLQSLRSIENSRTKYCYEVIVVDNDSADGSIEYLQPLFTQVEFIALSTNIGFGRANNIGFEKSKGKYILILNPDTILREDTLEVMYNFMELNPDCGISGCKVLNADGSFQVACRRGFPTPWASFSKLFGLQSIFPKSKLFAQYNQLYKSIDETYEIDAVIGAFMFCQRELIEKVQGFDADFFMYGEDLDLCFKVKELGYKVLYLHTTSIIHFKGESTKRSSINDVKRFYEAMIIYAQKRHNQSKLFLFSLKLGIYLRSFIAYLLKYKRDLFYILLDLIGVNLALLISTKIRFQEFFAFPEYAYPTVFIVYSLILLISGFSIGEYLEGKRSIKKSTFALFITFFVLSSLTYFIPEYRFSRGILLMSIFFALLFNSFTRFMSILFDKTKGREADRRIVIVGNKRTSEKIIKSFDQADLPNAHIVGIVTGKTHNRENSEHDFPILGDLSYLKSIIEKNRIKEVIITDPDISPNDLMGMMIENANSSVRFHSVNEDDDLIVSSIINEISGIENILPKYNIAYFRYKLIKRIEDILIPIFLFTIGFPLTIYLSGRIEKLNKKLIKTFTGKMSFIGTISLAGNKSEFGKEGIITLADLSAKKNISNQAARQLNNYYLKKYTPALDFDIFIKYLVRKK